jgi:hypothetical protein
VQPFFLSFGSILREKAANKWKKLPYKDTKPQLVCGKGMHDIFVHSDEKHLKTVEYPLDFCEIFLYNNVKL